CAKASFPDVVTIIAADLGLAYRLRLTVDFLVREFEPDERSANDCDPAFQLRADDGSGSGVFQSPSASPRRGADDEFQPRPESSAGRDNHLRGNIVTHRHDKRPCPRETGVVEDF